MSVVFSNRVAVVGQVSQIELEAGGGRRIARLVARRVRAAARYLYVNVRDDGIELVTYPERHEHRDLDQAVGFVLGEIRSELLAHALIDRVGRMLPKIVRRDIPEHLDGAARLACANIPLLRELATLRPDLEVPTSLPSCLHKVFSRPHLRDALSLLTGVRATRPATRRLAEQVVQADGRLRLRELSMLPAARGLSAGEIQNLIDTLPTVGDGGDLVHPRDAWHASQALASLGSAQAHRHALEQALGRRDGHQLLANLGSMVDAAGLVTVGCTSLDHLHERTRSLADQRFNRLQGQPSGVHDQRLIVALPGHDHELHAAGMDMHNCLDEHVAGGDFELTEGAIVLSITPSGRREHAIQVDGHHRVVQWRARHNNAPDLREVAAIATRLQLAGIQASPELISRATTEQEAPF